MSREESEYPVGVLTAQDRNVWAQGYKRLARGDFSIRFLRTFCMELMSMFGLISKCEQKNLLQDCFRIVFEVLLQFETCCDEGDIMKLRQKEIWGKLPLCAIGGFLPKNQNLWSYTYLSYGNPVQGFFVVDTISARNFPCNK